MDECEGHKMLKSETMVFVQAMTVGILPHLIALVAASVHRMVTLMISQERTISMRKAGLLIQL